MKTNKNYDLLTTESYFHDLFTSSFYKNKVTTPLLILDTRDYPRKKVDEYKLKVPKLKVALIIELPFVPEKLKPLFEDVDFVLPADLQPAEALAFFKALSPQPVSTLPAPSIARFRNHLYESLNVFFTLNPLNPTDLQNLRNAVHKLAGSCTMYGYPAFGRLVKDLDTLLTSHLFSNTPLPADFPATYQSFLRKALFAFQKIDVLC